MSGVAVTRFWGASTALAGTLTALAPAAASDLLSGPTPPPVAVVRVLGVREAAQGVTLLLRPTQGVVRLFLAVDAIHLVTMLAGVRLLPRYRQSEWVSAGAALGSIGLGLLSLRRHRAR